MTNISITKILPNPKQPRKNFNEETLRELAESIQVHGVIEPLIVEPGEDGTFILTVGERRLRAMKLLGMTSLRVGREVIVHERSNHNGREQLLKALVENIQREDMDPIETAKAYAELRDNYGMNNGQIAREVGKVSTQICAALDLLKAEPEIQWLWAQHKLTHEPSAVTAILSLPAGATRVQMALQLAERKATGKVIKTACRKFNELSQEKKNKDRSTPALRTAERLSDKRPEWDALYQLGKVPPWPLMNDVVMWTCDNCALRPMASESVCGQCALVMTLRKLTESIDSLKAEAGIHPLSTKAGTRVR
jgi:ParB family chromosome partitioning protein